MKTNTSPVACLAPRLFMAAKLNGPVYGTRTQSRSSSSLLHGGDVAGAMLHDHDFPRAWEVWCAIASRQRFSKLAFREQITRLAFRSAGTGQWTR